MAAIEIFPTPPRPRPRHVQIILLAGAVAMLLFPALAGLLHWPEAGNIDEKRALAPPPDWKTENLQAWTAGATSWIDDHFPQRARLILWNSFIRQRLLHAPSPLVCIGRDGWLFFAGDNTVEDFLGRDLLGPDELRRDRNALSGRRAWLKQRGIAYLLVVVPNKSTIYPEYMPALLRAGHRPGKLDQLLADLRAHTDLPVLDLRPALLAAKGGRILYLPWDAHWNGYAHLLACREILGALRAEHLEVGSADAARWVRMDAQERFFDCVDLLGLRGHWPVTPVPIIHLTPPPDFYFTPTGLTGRSPWRDFPEWKKVIATDRTSGRGRVVMFGDSFFRDGGIPRDDETHLPLSLEFRRFVSIWDNVDYDGLAAAAKLEKPDVVIEQVTERLFRSDIPADAPEWEAARVASPPPAAVSRER